LSKIVSGLGSGMASTRSRSSTAVLAAASSTSAKNSASAIRSFSSSRRTRLIGSLACQASTSLAMRYRDGSSEVVWAPIR
jgi:hypothetical protein